jgi:hypothetical protein
MSHVKDGFVYLTIFQLHGWPLSGWTPQSLAAHAGGGQVATVALICRINDLPYLKAREGNRKAATPRLA